MQTFSRATTKVRAAGKMAGSRKDGTCVISVAQVSLFFAIVFLNVAATTGKSDCSAVKFTGHYNRFQQNRIGVVFEQVSVDENGKPVFSFNVVDGSKEYLYCYQGRSYTYWGVGPFYKENRFGLQQQHEYSTHCTDHPADDKRTWELYNGTKMIPHPDVTVVCAQAPKRGTKVCDKVEIIGANIPLQRNRIGSYTHSRDNPHQGYIGTKPIFKNDKADMDEYIYPCSSDGYNRWCVGDLLGSDDAAMFVGSSVGHPAEITGTWYIYDGDS